MRLTIRQAETIRAAAREVFGPTATVRLFGSRADDALRGGDIDLYVATSPETADADHEVRFRALIWKALDEEQIDVVVAAHGQSRWIDRAALREGILL